MTNTFSISRLRKLMTKDWKRFYVSALISLSIQTIGVVLAFYLLGDNDNSSDTFTIFNRVFGFILMIILTIITTPSEIYPKANKLNPDLSFLMTPASNLEKFIAMALYLVIIMPLMAALMYVVADSIIVAIPGSGYDCLLWQYIDRYSVMNSFQWWLTLEHCLLLSAIAMLINTFFSGTNSFAFAILIPIWILIHIAKDYNSVTISEFFNLIVRDSVSAADFIEIGITIVIYYIAYRSMRGIRYHSNKHLKEENM